MGQWKECQKPQKSDCWEVWLNSSTVQNGRACACYSAPKIEADSFFVQLLNTKLCRSTLMVVLRRCYFLATCKSRLHHSVGALSRLARVHIVCKVLSMHLQPSAAKALLPRKPQNLQASYVI